MMNEMFEAAVYKQRRNCLMKTVGKGLVLLMGNEDSSMNYADNCYPFRQDSSFLYFTGLDMPQLALLLDCESGEEVLVGKELSIDDIVWMGPQPTLKEIAATAAIDHLTSWAELAIKLANARAQNRCVHYLPPYRPENKIKLAQLLSCSLEAISMQSSVLLTKAVIAQREAKDALEVAEIEKAINITVDMHLVAMKNARPGMKEYELAAMVEAVALSNNGRVSYPIILTKNGQTLHNHYHGNTLQNGDMVLCDAGAETSMHYAGDLTRTFPVAEKFTDRQAAAYDIVLNATLQAACLLKPGVLFMDVHLQAAIQLLQGLKALGLVKGDVEEAVHAGVHTLFFQCGLGHMMGLDVHDMEDLGEPLVGYTETLKKRTDFGWKSLRLGKALQPGFVLTVEPGLYFIPELIDRWQAQQHLSEFVNYTELIHWKNFGGIRVENNYLITEDGYRLLGKPLAQTVAEVEALRTIG